jgi:hypothetical protein
VDIVERQGELCQGVVGGPADTDDVVADAPGEGQEPLEEDGRARAIVEDLCSVGEFDGSGEPVEVVGYFVVLRGEAVEDGLRVLTPSAACECAASIAA